MSSLLRVIFDPDTTPPSVPTLNTPVIVGQDRIDLGWTSSTDTGGSGLAGYDLQIDGAAPVALGIQTSYSNTGLTAGSTHTYRVRSRDAAGNTSAYSNQQQGTTQGIPAGAGDLTTFTVEGTGTQVVSFGHTFSAGAVSSGTGVVVTDNSNNIIAGSQVDKRASWDDGSLFHATLHAQLTGGQTYKIRTGTPPTGTVKDVTALLAAFSDPDIARINITGSVSGSATLRDLLSSATNRASGGLEIREQGITCLGLTVSRDITTHLRVGFFVRWYGGTTLYFDPFFEVGYVNQGGMNSVSYTATCILNGATVLTRTLSPHYNRTSWGDTLGFWTTGGTLYARQKARPLMDSRAFGNYGGFGTSSAGYLNGLRQTIVPMDIGDYSLDLDGVGAHDDLAWLPRWEAAHFTNDCDSRTYKCILANSVGAGLYPHTCNDTLTGHAIRVSDHPTFVSFDGTGFPSGFSSGLGPADTTMQSSHLPSICYTAYILTGREQFLRRMHHAACFAVIAESTSRNLTSGGMTVRRSYNPSLRGHGWWIRSVSQAARSTPTGHPLKTYLTNCINGHAAYDNARVGLNGDSKNNLGVEFGTDEGFLEYRNFMAQILQTGLQCALDLGYSAFLPVARYYAQYLMAMAGSTGDYAHELGPGGQRVVGSNATTPFTTFEQVALANGATFISGSNAAMTATGLARNVEFGLPNTVDYYYAQSRPPLSFMEDLGMTGGREAWARHAMSNPTGWNDSPQYAFLPRKVPRATWVKNAPLLTVGILNNTVETSVAWPPGYGGLSGNIENITRKWQGKAIKTKGAELINFRSEGHSDGPWNGLLSIILNVENPIWVRRMDPTPAGQIIQNSAWNADGKAGTCHTYWKCQYVSGRDRVIQVGMAGLYPNGASATDTAAFDMTNYLPLPEGTYVNGTNSNKEGQPCCKDMRGESIWYINCQTGSPIIYNYKTGGSGTVTAVATCSPANTVEIYTAMGLDPNRHRAIVTHGYNQTEGWFWINLDTGVKTALPALSSQFGNGGVFIWDPTPGADRWWYVPRDGLSLWTISASTYAFAQVTLANSGQLLDAFSPSGEANGIYGKVVFAWECGMLIFGTQGNQNLRYVKVYDYDNVTQEY